MPLRKCVLGAWPWLELPRPRALGQLQYLPGVGSMLIMHAAH
jgi:hypothetical protein